MTVMLPNRMRLNMNDQPRAGGRRNLPVWLVATGVVGVLLLIVFVWVALGMGTPPGAEPVTVDVPVKL